MMIKADEFKLMVYGVAFGIAGQMLWNAFSVYITTFWGRYLPPNFAQAIGGAIVAGLLIYLIRLRDHRERSLDPSQKKLESFSRL